MLLAIVGLRSLAHMGLFTFVPLYELSRGNSAAYGTQLLSVFLFAGALGTLIGGPLADRFGRRRVLLGSFVVSPPLILVYALVGGPVGAVALFLAGMAVIGTFGVTLVMSQEYMPGRVGMASGLSIGLAIGLGGVAAVALGAVADALDLEAAVLATTLGPALCIFLTLLLPPPRRVRSAEPEPAPDRRPLMPETAKEFFEHLAARTADGSERTRGLTATYRFDVADAGSWRVAVDDGAVAVSEGDGAADCVISVPEDLFLRIVRGEQSPMGAFLMGKIKVEGDTGAGDAPEGPARLAARPLVSAPAEARAPARTLPGRAPARRGTRSRWLEGKLEQLPQRRERPLLVPRRRPDAQLAVRRGERVREDERALLGEPERGLVPAAPVVEGAPGRLAARRPGGPARGRSAGRRAGRRAQGPNALRPVAARRRDRRRARGRA